MADMGTLLARNSTGRRDWKPLPGGLGCQPPALRRLAEHLPISRVESEAYCARPTNGQVVGQTQGRCAARSRRRLENLLAIATKWQLAPVVHRSKRQWPLEGRRWTPPFFRFAPAAPPAKHCDHLVRDGVLCVQPERSYLISLHPLRPAASRRVAAYKQHRRHRCRGLHKPNQNCPLLLTSPPGSRKGRFALSVA